ncbi:MAG TPA: 16S rRNA (cytosine(1402)-N(4))-methyltransferase RsmH [Candidatus Saccharimonadales bacterium]|nr:16S rRNA (cytosine(1402)-N(4))-methyltransferase RsmH [Candidatus Saccharimonadales bacterium]
MHQDNKPSNEHIPVLLQAVLKYLNPKEGDSYLDLTGGYGGHASEILGITKHPTGTVLVDRDPNAVKSLRERFATSGVEIIQKDFLSASQKLAARGSQFDLILADLGVSSPHLNQASRGFSIQQDGPLDMRMDTTQELTAEKVVNTYSAEELTKILQTYGEEPKARQISTLIVRERPIQTTQQLATIAAKAWPGHSKVHPATRTFQAIRVAVNNELGLLEAALPIWIEQLLAPGGRIVVISFHSLEDRLVKQAFSEAGGERYDATLSILTKHPVSGSEQEIVFNPRARSAKLRAAVKQT